MRLLVLGAVRAGCAVHRTHRHGLAGAAVAHDEDPPDARVHHVQLQRQLHVLLPHDLDEGESHRLRVCNSRKWRHRGEAGEA